MTLALESDLVSTLEPETASSAFNLNLVFRACATAARMLEERGGEGADEDGDGGEGWEEAGAGEVGGRRAAAGERSARRLPPI